MPVTRNYYHNKRPIPVIIYIRAYPPLDMQTQSRTSLAPK